jgi:thiol-disulfide isomerase/thioredoxin
VRQILLNGGSALRLPIAESAVHFLNMKKLLVLLAFAALLTDATAQTAKKYLLIEHFTNSWCSVCRSKNPTFYNTIAPYSADIHHIAIHPSTPYAQCVFYQANKTDNQTRADYYGIFATPRVALNGNLLNTSNALLPTSSLQNSLAQNTSPVSLKVTDGVNGSSINATVTLRFHGAVPAGNYRLYVAVVEKQINLTTPNQETVHRDVLRDMLTAATGDPITVLPAGQAQQLTFTAPLGNWNTSDLYVLAYLQNDDTKEVLNSGTRFDVSTDAKEAVVDEPLRIYPNPARETAWFLTTNVTEEIHQIEVTDLSGRTFPIQFIAQGDHISFSVSDLPKGIYILKALTSAAMHTGKLMISR